jgi:hypothetical protein
MKRFSFGEVASLQFRFEMLNLFNRHYFGGPSTNLNDPFFGSIRTASGGRVGQFGMRLDW